MVKLERLQRTFAWEVNTDLSPANPTDWDIVRQNRTTIADVPDESGSFQLNEGGSVSVDLSRVDPSNEKQVLFVELPNTARREVHLSSEGTGATPISEGEIVLISLHEPIRRKGEWRRVRDREKKVKWIPRESRR